MIHLDPVIQNFFGQRHQPKWQEASTGQKIKEAGSSDMRDEELIPDTIEHGLESQEQPVTNPFLNSVLSPSSMRVNTADVTESVDIKTFNAKSRSNIFKQSKQVKPKVRHENKII